jgi:hypothetical protein
MLTSVLQHIECLNGGVEGGGGGGGDIVGVFILLLLQSGEWVDLHPAQHACRQPVVQRVPATNSNPVQFFFMWQMFIDKKYCILKKGTSFYMEPHHYFLFDSDLKFIEHNLKYMFSRQNKLGQL